MRLPIVAVTLRSRQALRLRDRGLKVTATAKPRFGRLGVLCVRVAFGVLVLLSLSAPSPAQTLFTNNAFVTGKVESGTGKIDFFAGSAFGSGNLSFNSYSFLTVLVGGQTYSNNDQSIAPPDHKLDNGVNSKNGDTIETVWPESGFDIVQDVYPVAFEISGQIVYKIKVVNHNAVALNVQAQYLLDIDVANNDKAKVLTRWNYTPNWKQYPDSLGRTPWFFMGFQKEPPASQVGATISTGYLNDTLAPQPMGLMQPIVFDVVDWSDQSVYVWGVAPSAPWGTPYGDNAVLLQWRAFSVNGNLGSDSIQEIGRGSYGTGEFDICSGSLIGLTFYPHHLIYDFKTKKYLHNPFQVLSMIFNTNGSSSIDTTIASLTVNGSLRIISPKPVTNGGLMQSQGIGEKSKIDTGGSIAPLDVAQALWIDSTLDVINCTKDSIVSLLVNVTTKSPITAFTPPCQMSLAVDCASTITPDVAPPKVFTTGGGEFDSTFNITDSTSIDMGIRSITWTFSPPTANKYYRVRANTVDSVSPANFACLKSPVPLHITQLDSTQRACIDFTFTDCNNNVSTRNVCFNSHIPAGIKDLLPPKFTLLNRVHWPYNNDSSSLTKRGCNTSQHSYWLVADTQLNDRGLGTIDSVIGQSYNMTLVVTPFGVASQLAYFEVIIQDSMIDGRMIVRAMDTAGNVAYDTITYCTVPDIVPPTATAVPLPNGSGYHVHASDNQPWDRKIRCVYITGMTNVFVVLPAGYDSTRAKGVGGAPDTLIVCAGACDTTLDFDVLKDDTISYTAFIVQGRDCTGNVSYPPYTVGASGKTDGLCPNISWFPLFSGNSNVETVSVSDYHFTAQGQEIAYDDGIDSIWFTGMHNMELVVATQMGDLGPGNYFPPQSIHFPKDASKHPEYPKSATFQFKVYDMTTIDPLSACITVNGVDGAGNVFCFGDTTQWCYTLSQDRNPPQAFAAQCTDTSLLLTATDTGTNELGLHRFWLDANADTNFVPFDTTYSVQTTGTPPVQTGPPTGALTLRVQSVGKSATATIHALDLMGSKGAAGHETTFPVWMYVQDLKMKSSQLLLDSGAFTIPVYLVPNDSIPVSQKRLTQCQFSFHLTGSNLINFVRAETAGTLSSACVVTPGANRSYVISDTPASGMLPDLTPAQMASTPLVLLRFQASETMNAELCDIVPDGTDHAQVRYNGDNDSTLKGTNFVVTSCPPYGNVTGSVVVIKGLCSPIVGPNLKPSAISLAPTIPNPASSGTSVIYTIPTDAIVKLELYNELGDRVRTLVAEPEKQGEYKLEFSTTDFATGTYFLRLESAGKVVSRRMSLQH